MCFYCHKLYNDPYAPFHQHDTCPHLKVDKSDKSDKSQKSNKFDKFDKFDKSDKSK